MKLPKHECGLYLEHNSHKDVYETIERHLEMNEPDWPSEEAKRRAIATNELWVLHWYPHTPIGSHKIAAPTLKELLEFAARECDEMVEAI